ncbi:MAG: 2-oxoacid:ferredoxin oxidoreductase subunit beta [Chloroflexi bacterium]|nr:2-oxoacid:ferredoxin oxidoreductase subunit beta [Chloroflexota bacterium]MCL5107472.1 2-oxoacid:ferredoxin oxidoreductase subunit beta [Chloroflexota bacterium]MDA8219772.1 2-oxoacid:ferredoxin oxidoreductase subunit beta [Dehalococcoidales bacterium]
MQTLPPIHEYLRSHKKFPHVWCAGCGAGNVLGSIIRAVGHLGLDRDEVAMVSGIGCSGRMPVYADFNTLHTTHGRALAFATGIKLAKPNMQVLVVMGDGDALAIGGNHFIHAARRNVDLTAIVVNNGIYGLTGGQVSPTTPMGAYATTATYGQIERPFDIAKIADAAGASFVARGTVYHILELEKLIEQAIVKRGFSVVEVISQCHTAYGRLNMMPTAVEMLKWQRDNTISVAAVAAGKSAEGKITRGVLVDRELPEFTDVYFNQVVARAQELTGRAER